ncbi:MAG: hypothetical protein JWP37_217 [Mucilaginibacter sp.]|nr:hypothetical protein [Mucilaginibacter sp.]
MKIGLGRIICAAVICVWSIQAAKAQSYRQLTAADFEGAPRSHTGVIAYTNCTIDFQYQAYRKNGYYSLTFDIQLMMNRNKSWMDKSRISSSEMLAAILKHEQGHYIIAYLEQQELLRTVGKTRFGADYQRIAQEIFDRIDAKYKQLNLDYDEDTGHMTNRVQQNSWDAYFRKRLEFMPPT